MILISRLGENINSLLGLKELRELEGV
jgi:hypothetical protein